MALEAWQSGRRIREELTIRDFERLIELGAFNELGILNKQPNSTTFKLHVILRWTSAKSFD